VLLWAPRRVAAHVVASLHVRSFSGQLWAGALAVALAIAVAAGRCPAWFRSFVPILRSLSAATLVIVAFGGSQPRLCELNAWVCSLRRARTDRLRHVPVALPGDGHRLQTFGRVLGPVAVCAQSTCRSRQLSAWVSYRLVSAPFRRLKVWPGSADAGPVCLCPETLF